MLAAAQRLRRSAEFATAIRTGRKAGRGAVIVHLTIPPHSTDEPASAPGAASATPTARAGFVVSKAVGGAVVRNRVRRRLSHLVRERLDPLPPGTTLVIRALPAAAGRPYPQLGRDLDEAIAAARSARRGGGRRPRPTDRRAS